MYRRNAHDESSGSKARSTPHIGLTRISRFLHHEGAVLGAILSLSAGCATENADPATAGAGLADVSGAAGLAGVSGGASARADGSWSGAAGSARGSTEGAAGGLSLGSSMEVNPSGSNDASTEVAGLKPELDAAVDADAADSPDLSGLNNPVLAGLNADPQVALFDGTFYIYPTTDGFPNWGSTSFSVFSSTNLVRWSNRGVILDFPRDLTWAVDRAWAPAIARKGDVYYFYFSAAQSIGVATSTSPTGPFEDALGRPLIAAGQYGVQVIDPFVFIDDDGTAYLYFGSGGARVVTLNADMTSFSGTPVNITPTGFREGSVVFKRQGEYYFLWSENDTRSVDYRVAYGRSTSPFGPFNRVGAILQTDTALGILATGHNAVLAIPGRDEYYFVYHRFAIPGGDGTHREVCIDPMYFNDDGSIAVVRPTLQGLQRAVTP